MKRNEGFYWVCIKSGMDDRWIVCEWTGVYWAYLGVSHSDIAFLKIDENQIINPNI